MKFITKTAAVVTVGGVLLAANPASAAVASYRTDFTDVTINTAQLGTEEFSTADWRMTGPYDAQIKDGALRISNATTSGSFTDMLFAPELAVGAVEGSEVDTFTAKFTIKPHDLQPGLRVTVAPDNGDGGRAGHIAITHTATGMNIESSGSYFDAAEDLQWTVTPVAVDLDPKFAHTVQLKLIKKVDTAKSTNNDVFSVKVDAKPVKNTTFEAYYDATDEPQYETDTLMFRLSSTAQPQMADSKGMLFDDVSMSVS